MVWCASRRVGRRLPRGIVLDMDSSVSPTHGEQEMSVWRTLKPVVARYQRKVSRFYFRADAAFAMPGVYEYLEAERIKYAIRLPANQVLPGQDRLSAQASGWAASKRGAPVSCELQLSGRKLDQAAPGGCEGRVASRRTLSPRRLHRDEHEPPGRACGRVLQQARHVRAMDQGRQGRDQMDAAVVPDVRGQPCSSNFMRAPTISATSCARWRRPSRSKTGRSRASKRS